MNSNGSDGIATVESVEPKPAGSRCRRRARLSASHAFTHNAPAVAEKTTKKTPAFVPIVVQKTWG
jgi:hypothetical protein